jgi:transcriptional regulator with XRE-family HTH domain
MDAMPQTNKTTQPPLMIGDETFGQRLARIRKSKGYTQVELSQKMDIVQVLISDYERDKLRPYHEMIVRFAKALEVSADELLGLKPIKKKGGEPSLKLIRRVKKIEALPPAQQKFVLKTIDSLIKAAQK